LRIALLSAPSKKPFSGVSSPIFACSAAENGRLIPQQHSIPTRQRPLALGFGNAKNASCRETCAVGLLCGLLRLESLAAVARRVDDAVHMILKTAVHLRAA
jgi:hypothetical protein